MLVLIHSSKTSRRATTTLTSDLTTRVIPLQYYPNLRERLLQLEYIKPVNVSGVSSWREEVLMEIKHKQAERLTMEVPYCVYNNTAADITVNKLESERFGFGTLN